VNEADEERFRREWLNLLSASEWRRKLEAAGYRLLRPWETPAVPPCDPPLPRTYR
jgi:hypothetical protein